MTLVHHIKDGQAELDAAIMEGKMGAWQKGDPAGKLDRRKRAGAVAAVRHLRNPISAARAILEDPRQGQVLLAGEGAERFALSDETRQRYPGQIVEVSNVYFWTGRQHPRRGLPPQGANSSAPSVRWPAGASPWWRALQPAA